MNPNPSPRNDGKSTVWVGTGSDLEPVDYFFIEDCESISNGWFVTRSSGFTV